jgi:hypothetical protein
MCQFHARRVDDEVRLAQFVMSAYGELKWVGSGSVGRQLAERLQFELGSGYQVSFSAWGA